MRPSPACKMESLPLLLRVILVPSLVLAFPHFPVVLSGESHKVSTISNSNELTFPDILTLWELESLSTT